MITIEMPEPPTHDLVLAPRDDQFRGDAPAPGAREPLRHRVSVGGPVFRRIEADDATDDMELRHFLAEEAVQSDFYLLHLTCTLRPSESEPFTEALIEISLTDPGLGAKPIAWSMQPDRLVDAVEVSRTVSLGPTLKILGVDLELKAEQQRTRTRQEPFLEAMYELESTPSWALYRTAGVELRGLYRFHLVVRAPKGAAVKGTTLVEAKVQRRLLGVIPYRASIANAQLPTAFTLQSRNT